MNEDDNEPKLGEGAACDLIDPKHVRRDLRTLERAIRNQWEIPEKLFRLAPVLVGRVLKTGTDREKLNAAKVLVAMHESNRKDDGAPQRIEHQHTHEIGPRTTENIEDAKRRLAARIVERHHNAGATVGAGEVA